MRVKYKDDRFVRDFEYRAGSRLGSRPIFFPLTFSQSNSGFYLSAEQVI